MLEGYPQINQGVIYASKIIQQISAEIYKTPQDTLILILLLTMLFLFILLIFSVRRVRGGESKKRVEGMGDEEIIIPHDKMMDRPSLEPHKSLLEEKNLEGLLDEFPEEGKSPAPEEKVHLKEKGPIEETVSVSKEKPMVSSVSSVKKPETESDIIEKVFADFPQEGVSLIIRIKPSKIKEKIVEKIVEVPVETVVDRIVEREAGQKSHNDEYPINEEIKLEEDTDLITASEILTKKYGLRYLTIANSDGQVVASTSPAPDEDAANALSLSKQFDLGKEIHSVAISGHQERYIIYCPVNSNHTIINLVSNIQIPGRVLEMFEEETKTFLEKII